PDRHKTGRRCMLLPRCHLRGHGWPDHSSPKSSPASAPSHPYLTTRPTAPEPTRNPLTRRHLLSTARLQLIGALASCDAIMVATAPRTSPRPACPTAPKRYSSPPPTAPPTPPT